MDGVKVAWEIFGPRIGNDPYFTCCGAGGDATGYLCPLGLLSLSSFTCSLHRVFSRCPSLGLVADPMTSSTWPDQSLQPVFPLRLPIQQLVFLPVFFAYAPQSELPRSVCEHWLWKSLARPTDVSSFLLRSFHTQSLPPEAASKKKRAKSCVSLWGLANDMRPYLPECSVHQK
jgi:hypothetical protein